MRVVVTGAGGQVGVELLAALARRDDVETTGWTRAELDITDRASVIDAIAKTAPAVVFHPAAFTAVDACETEVDRAFAVNALATRHVAEAARAIGAHLVYLSTDYVFDGTLDRPYREWDQTNPRSVYGASKLGGELECDATATIARTSWVCGRVGQNMAKTVLRIASQSDGPLRFVDDQHGSPTIAHDLAQTLVTLGLERRPGRFHVTNQGETTWFGFAQAVLSAAGLDPGRVEPITTAELDPPRPAPRPANSVLDNAALRLSGLALLPEWDASLSNLVTDLVAAGGAG
jgi:dTDP-4-dehydrorhamnose reductase